MASGSKWSNKHHFGSKNDLLTGKFPQSQQEKCEGQVRKKQKLPEPMILKYYFTLRAIITYVLCRAEKGVLQH